VGRGALALAVLAALNLLLAGQPWGVVYGFGLWAAKLARRWACSTPLATPSGARAATLQRLGQTLLLDVTSITNIGILGGALWVAAGKGPPCQAAERHANGPWAWWPVL
jgi:hypothetical protein